MISLQKQLTPTVSHLFLLPQATLIEQKSAYKIELVNKASLRRQQVEAFIADSYAEHFHAKLTTFFPVIITVIQKTNNKIVAALGLRYADTEKLFSENYLDKPIEQLIHQTENYYIQRKKIMELGNFAVASKYDVKKILPVIAGFIRSIHVDYLVYTLTQPIKAYFDFFALELKYLAKANISAINHAADDWGIYYDLNPSVYITNVVRNQNKL